MGGYNLGEIYATLGITDENFKSYLESSKQNLNEVILELQRMTAEIQKGVSQELTGLDAVIAQERVRINLLAAKMTGQQAYNMVLARQAELEAESAAANAEGIRQETTYAANAAAEKAAIDADYYNLKKQLHNQEVVAAKAEADRVKAIEDELEAEIMGAYRVRQELHAALMEAITAQEKGQAAATISIQKEIQAATVLGGRAAGGFLGAGAARLGLMSEIAGAAVGLTAAVYVLGKWTEQAGEAARKTENLATALGLTWQQTRNLEEEAQLAGVDINNFKVLSEHLSEALTDTEGKGKTAAKALVELGVSGRTSGELLINLIQKLSEMGNSDLAKSKVFEIMGRGAPQLLEMVAHFKEVNDIITKMGPNLDDNLRKKLEDAKTQLSELGVAWDRFKERIAAKIGGDVAGPASRGISDFLGGKIKDLPLILKSLGAPGMLFGALWNNFNAPPTSPGSQTTPVGPPLPIQAGKPDKSFIEAQNDSLRAADIRLQTEEKVQRDIFELKRKALADEIKIAQDPAVIAAKLQQEKELIAKEEAMTVDFARRRASIQAQYEKTTGEPDRPQARAAQMASVAAEARIRAANETQAAIQEAERRTTAVIAEQIRIQGELYEGGAARAKQISDGLVNAQINAAKANIKQHEEVSKHVDELNKKMGEDQVKASEIALDAERKHMVALLEIQEEASNRKFQSGSSNQTDAEHQNELIEIETKIRQINRQAILDEIAALRAREGVTTDSASKEAALQAKLQAFDDESAARLDRLTDRTRGFSAAMLEASRQVESGLHSIASSIADVVVEHANLEKEATRTLKNIAKIIIVDLAQYAFGELLMKISAVGSAWYDLGKKMASILSGGGGGGALKPMGQPSLSNTIGFNGNTAQQTVDAAKQQANTTAVSQDTIATQQNTTADLSNTTAVQANTTAIIALTAAITKLIAQMATQQAAGGGGGGFFKSLLGGLLGGVAGALLGPVLGLGGKGGGGGYVSDLAGFGNRGPTMSHYGNVNIAVSGAGNPSQLGRSIATWAKTVSPAFSPYASK